MRSIERPDGFWRDVTGFRCAVTAPMLWRLLLIGVFATLVCGTDWTGHHRPELEVGIAPYEVAGAALGLLLVVRTNAGYERWWEGRRLWGGIVNQCRHLGVVVLSYGPEGPAWRDWGVRLVAAFAHATRGSLRGEREVPQLAALLGAEETARIAAAPHTPGYVALLLGDHLRVGCDRLGMDRFAFLEADRDLASLLDHVGGCERIKRTPLPRAYAVLIRQFIVLFLVTLPFGLLKKVDGLTPLVTLLIAYPLLALDEIGDALQAPFSTRNLNHLPLDQICRTIEDDLLAMLATSSGSSSTPEGEATPVQIVHSHR